MTSYADQAIAALTSAAKQTRTRGGGTEFVIEEPVDAAEIIVHVITAVAANLGGVDQLIAGRPGSWEAGLVERLVLSNIADDNDLLRYRTDPIRLHLDVGEEFSDFGLTTMMWTEQDEAGKPLLDDNATEEEQDRAQELVDAIEALYEADEDAYAASYAEAVRRELASRGIDLPLELIRTESYDSSLDTDPISQALHEHAHLTTPLPATGQAPDFDGGHTPADAVREAGRSYTARIAETRSS